MNAQLKAVERGVSQHETPHLSHSRINRYLHCPEQYRLYYVENLRPRIPDASLLFGKAIHEVLEALFLVGQDPVEFFRMNWGSFKDQSVRYKQRESWESLLATGVALLQKFVREELQRVGPVRSVERSFVLKITSLIWPLVGIIDLVAELDGIATVIDFKTSASSYPPHEVALSDQLTTYQLVEPDIDRTALCVLVKTKEPKIEWHTSQRDGAHLTEFLHKAEYVAGEIAAERFYKRPGKWCSYCDYLPVCLGDKEKSQEALVELAHHQ